MDFSQSKDTLLGARFMDFRPYKDTLVRVRPMKFPQRTRQRGNAQAGPHWLRPHRGFLFVPGSALPQKRATFDIPH